ncbi:TlyA family RNA methyltransferase [Candidatus Poribacteria bacterium]|nr:TlyA family RNA methyltransferase [Candidatus Poribacteria bacterium]MYF54586.1 TlyA family RNA methyltransferase [Candidatus Poribacteria bacterium]MYI93926.1 TlyA family RNA methyltransferase [Candidatus Poribacteria bacterium]
MERLDIALVKRGYVESRLQAKRLILAGAVKVNNNPKVKPGQSVSNNDEIEVKPSARYVSRGGLKLEKALIEFNIKVQDKVAIDVGASTGGFTDCLLQHGAKYVYAVDVGYGQLAWKLRQDCRVEVIDRTNIRYIDPNLFTFPPEIAVLDVSFISIRKVLPVLFQTLAVPDTIALVKPQFEAGRVHIKKGGIVDDPKVHRKLLEDLVEFVRNDYSVNLMALTFSPIYQDIANIEYLLWLRDKDKINDDITDFSRPVYKSQYTDMSHYINQVVDTAHNNFSAHT